LVPLKIEIFSFSVKGCKDILLIVVALIMNYEMRSAEAVSSFSGHYQSSSNVDEVLTAPPAPKKRRVKVKVVEPVQALETEAKVLQHLEPEAKVIVPEAKAFETNEAAAEIKKLI